MFSKRRSRSNFRDSYTGVSATIQPPSEVRPSSGAVAAAAAIGKALKDSNGSVAHMNVPSATRRTNSLQSRSNSFARTSSLSSQNYRPPSRTGSLVYQSSSPMSFRRKSVDHFEDAREYQEPKKPQQQPQTVRHKVSFSSEPTKPKMVKRYVPSANGLVAIEVPVYDPPLPTVGSQRRISRSSSMGSLSLNNKRQVARNNSLSNSKPVTKKASTASFYKQEPIIKEDEELSQADIQRQSTPKKQTPKVEVMKPVEPSFEKSVDQSAPREPDVQKISEEEFAMLVAEKEREILEQIKAELLEANGEEPKDVESVYEAESVYSEHTERAVDDVATPAEEEVVEKAESSAEKEVPFEAEPSVEKKIPLEAVSLVGETEITVEKFINEAEASEEKDLTEKTIENVEPKEEVSVTTVPILAVNEAPSVREESAVKETHPHMSDNSSAELNFVSNYSESKEVLNMYSEPETAPQTSNSNANISPSTSATSDYSSHEIDTETKEEPSLSMAQQLRSTMPALSHTSPIVPQSATFDNQEVPQRSSKRPVSPQTLNVPSQDPTLQRRRSALKQASRTSLNTTSSSTSSPAAQAYLSLTTAENTRLNAQMSQSSLNIVASQSPEKPPQNHQPQQSYQAPKQAQPSPMRNTSIRRSMRPQSEGPGMRTSLRPAQQQQPRQRQSMQPQQNVNGFAAAAALHNHQNQQPSRPSSRQSQHLQKPYPKSDAQLRAAELYKAANTPRSNRHGQQPYTPELERSSSYEKVSQDIDAGFKKMTMRDEMAASTSDSQQQQPATSTPIHSNYNRGNFKSRFVDSDDEPEIPTWSKGHNGELKQHTLNGQRSTSDMRQLPAKQQPRFFSQNPEPKQTSGASEEKKKRFGKLKKLFGRSST